MITPIPKEELAAMRKKVEDGCGRNLGRGMCCVDHPDPNKDLRCGECETSLRLLDYIEELEEKTEILEADAHQGE